MRARSVVAIVLPSFRVALVRARSPDIAPHAPLCVVVHEERDERSLSGGTRIDEVSDEARELGIYPGATIASARAKHADLHVRVLKPRETTCALEGLAEMLLGFGAITSPRLDRDAVLVDVTGCAHLHGGDEGLVTAIAAAVRRVGFVCRAVLAPGPEIALALAFGQSAGSGTRVVTPEETMRALAELPIDVLRLEARTTAYFHRLGVSTIAQLRALPRASLTSRLENANLVTRVRAILDGDDKAPITRFQPEEIIEERIEVEYGIERHDALFFVLKSLCDRLAARLQGRAVLASRIEVMLELDRAMCPEGTLTRESVSLPLACPVHESGEIFAALRSRIEREPPLRAPALTVALRAPDLTPAHAVTKHMFEPESRAEIALPKLARELSALLGEGALGTLAVVDDLRLDHRSKLLPFGARRRDSMALVSSGPEPIRYFAQRRLPTRAPLKLISHLARFEQLLWWREAPTRIDWQLAWTGEAMAFVEVDIRGHTMIRGYLD